MGMENHKECVCRIWVL